MILMKPIHFNQNQIKFEKHGRAVRSRINVCIDFFPTKNNHADFALINSIFISKNNECQCSDCNSNHFF